MNSDWREAGWYDGAVRLCFAFVFGRHDESEERERSEMKLFRCPDPASVMDRWNEKQIGACEEKIAKTSTKSHCVIGGLPRQLLAR